MNIVLAGYFFRDLKRQITLLNLVIYYFKALIISWKTQIITVRLLTIISIV